MSNVISFSRLLKIFTLYGNNAFIIELINEDFRRKELYISYKGPIGLKFESYEETELKKEFTGLSDHCLMDQCVDASYMFWNAPITLFDTDCTALKKANNMFQISQIKRVYSRFPNLENGDYMFESSELSDIEGIFPKLETAKFMFAETRHFIFKIDLPKLKDATCMFLNAEILGFSSNINSLEVSTGMFSKSTLSYFDSEQPKNLKEYKNMFYNTAEDFKTKLPQYFV